MVFHNVMGPSTALRETWRATVNRRQVERKRETVSGVEQAKQGGRVDSTDAGEECAETYVAAAQLRKDGVRGQVRQTLLSWRRWLVDMGSTPARGMLSDVVGRED